LLKKEVIWLDQQIGTISYAGCNSIISGRYTSAYFRIETVAPDCLSIVRKEEILKKQIQPEKLIDWVEE